MKIECQKAKQRCSHHEQPSGHGTVAMSNQEQAACGNDTDPGRKPIHVVQQIQRVSDTKNPKERERVIEGRVVKQVVNNPTPNCSGGYHELRCKLPTGTQLKNIIHQPYEPHCGS